MAVIAVGAGLANLTLAVVLFRAVPNTTASDDPVSAAMTTGGLVVFYVVPAAALALGLFASGIGCWYGSRRAVTGAAFVLSLTVLWASFVALATWNSPGLAGGGVRYVAPTDAALSIVGIALVVWPGAQWPRA